jgi:YbbR domain-containing protein
VKPRRFFGHFGLKLISLTAAVFLWFVVSGEETVERGLRVPLELQQLPPNLEITGDVPTTVDVRIRGGSGTLSRVNPGDVVAVLDLRAARPGRRVFSVTQDQVRVPFGVDVVQIAPSAIAMVFEPTASRQVQVVPAIDGRPAAGFVVGKTTTEPATVEVVGPEAAVKHATEAVTEPVPVSGATERVRETVTLGLLDPSLRLKNVRSATVTVQIEPGPQERMFRSRAVHLRNVPEGLAARAEPTAVDVGVRGSRDSLARLEPDEVVAYVDLAGLGAGDYQLTVHAEAARDAGVTHIEPVTVHIRMTSVR